MHDFEEYGIQGINPRHSGDQKTTCPKCSSGRKKSGEPCLSVNVAEGVWNCWHCGKSGSLKTGWSDEAQARSYNRDSYAPNSWQRQYRPVEVLAQVESAPDKVLEWFAGRGIPAAVVERNGIGVEERFVQQVKQKRNCIAFVYRVGGKSVNVKYRDGEKNFSQVKGGDKVFYKLDDIDDSEDVIITEGEIDALSFEVAGMVWAVSVPDGAINENVKNLRSKLEYLDNCAAWFEGKRRVYLATDTDAPGLRLRDELARRLGKERCWIIRYPDDCKDANEVLVKYGAEKLRRCVVEAEPYPIAGIYDLSSCEDELNDIYEYGFPEGAKLGMTYIDQHFQFYPGQLTVITGIPSHGKSTWCDFQKMQLSKKWGWRHGVFTPENNPPSVLLERLCCMYAGKPMRPNYKDAERMTPAEFQQAKDFIRDHFYFVHPEDSRFSVDAILELGSVLVVRRGIAGFEVDPWNNIEHLYAKGESETAYIGRTLNQFKFFARKHGLHFFLIAHPTKMKKLADGRNYDVPNLYSIAGSANFFNVTDNGMAVYRSLGEFGEDDTYIYFEKVKHSYIGKTGRVKLKFNAHAYQYTEDFLGQNDEPSSYRNGGYDVDDPQPF